MFISIFSRMNYTFVGYDPNTISTKKSVRVYLNKDQTSYVSIRKKRYNMNEETFNTLWDMHPEGRGKIKLYGVEKTTPRWQQSYGRDYEFSGMNHVSTEVPEILKPFLKRHNGYNQILVNWYQGGDDYIGPHSDDERQLVPGSRIISYSFQRPDHKRIFRLKPKGGGKDRIDLELEDGMILIMGGKTQKTHTHQVPKLTKKQLKSIQKRKGISPDLKRINITLRKFND